MSDFRPAVFLLGDTLNIGGTEGQFAEVACRLDRSRWDVHVGCLRPEGPLRKRLDAAGVPVRAWGKGSFRSPRFFLAVSGLAAYLREHRIRLVHSFDFYSNILGIPAARVAGVPAVVVSQRELGDLRRRLQRAVQVATLRLADEVLVNAAAVAQRLARSRWSTPRRIHIVPNGVDVGRFCPPVSEPPAVTIGTLANLRPEKGIDDLIRAIAGIRVQCPQIRLSIWGDGPVRRDLEELVRDLGVGSFTTFHGATTTPEVALRECSVFVLPSRSEACPNSLLEAMATGLPVIATRVGGNAAIVQDEVTGLLVEPGDPAAIGKTIVRLLETPTMARELGTRARTHIERHFSMDTMVATIDRLYETAIKRTTTTRTVRRS